MSGTPFSSVGIGSLEKKNGFLMSAAVDGTAADPKTMGGRLSQKGSLHVRQYVRPGAGGGKTARLSRQKQKWKI